MKYICYGVRGSRPIPYNKTKLSQFLTKLVLDTGVKELENMVIESKKTVEESNEHITNTSYFDALQVLIEKKLDTYNKSLLNIAGNTPCLEVRGENTNDTQIIFDLGTGTSQAEILPNTKRLHIFLHIFIMIMCKDAFFNSLFNRNISVIFYSPVHGFEKYLNELMHHPYFPVTMSESMTSKILFRHLKRTAPIKINGLSITWKEINHPGGSYAYKIKDNKHTFCYFSDVCITDSLFKPSKFNQNFLENIDTMVLDCAMSFEDSIIKKYWGHSSLYTGIDFAHFWKVKSLYLFHFDPLDDISTLPVLYQSAQWYKQSINAKMDIDLAEESKWIEV